jgi:short-subunit dehydrogenase
VSRTTPPVAVITGAASGIGLALARGLAAEGNRLLLLDRNPARLAEAQAELPGAVALDVDVGDAAAMDEAAAACRAQLGLATSVCANAGIAGATGTRLWELPVEAWEEVLRVNLLGVVHTVRSFFPQLLEAGTGRLLVTASMAGVTPAPNMAPYFASKHAVVSLAETLRLQVERDRLPVSVSVLLPSRVATNIGESHDADFHMGEVLSTASAEMDPDSVARLALEAMTSGRFYVFTHPDSQPRVDAWYEEIVSSYAQARRQAEQEGAAHP